MKTIGIGIFVLLVAGLLFFTIQIVKRADLSVSAIPQTKASEDQTFVDTNSSLTFQHPGSWILQRSGPADLYAPVFKVVNADGQSGYFGIARKAAKRYESPAEDLDFYSEDPGFRSFLNEVVLRDVVPQSGTSSANRIDATPIGASEISFGKARPLTFRSGMQGFVVPYSVGTISGAAYFMYSYDSLIMTVSAFSGSQPILAGSGKIDPAYASFSAEIDAAMNTLIRT